MPKQLKDLDVKYLSLVDAGANLKTLVYKSLISREKGPGESGSFDSVSKHLEIRKVDQDKHLVYCIVYAPDEVDAHGHSMTAEEIEKAAHKFMKAARTNQVDKQHDEDPDEGYVAESWIVRKGDELFEEVGSWAVAIKVLNADTWQQVKKGEITGVSLQGWAVADEIQEEEKSLFKKFMELFVEHNKQPTSKDFKGRLMERQIYQAVYALEDEIRLIIDSDDYPTLDAMKGAINAMIEQFQTYVNNLETDTEKSFNPTVMSKQKKSKAEEPEKTGGSEEEPGELEKALSKAFEPIKKEIDEKLEGIEERLEKVEKAAPGSQSDKGEDDPGQVKKGYKGINVFGGSSRGE